MHWKLGLSGTKWEIFSTAVNLFADNGYHNVSMKDIARAVDIKAASIYNHFASKDAILMEIYNFAEMHSILRCKHLDSIMDELAVQSPVADAFFRTHMYYHPNIQDIMSKIILISFMQMRSDERADYLIQWMLIQSPQHYIRTLIDRMLEAGRIEPFDVDAFMEIYTNYMYGASMRMYSSHPVLDDTWIRGLKMIFSLIPEKKQD